MYILKQAVVLAYAHLSTLLKAVDYQPILGLLSMWKHKTKQKKFRLCVDDFGVKYFSKEVVQYLHDTIAKKYTCNIDWSGKNFSGYKIEL